MELQERYSSWSKLIKVTAIILRFVRLVRQTAKLRNAPHTNNDSQQTRSHSQVDIVAAKQYWLKSMQVDTFADEITVLKNNANLPPSNPISKLSPYLDATGLLRVGGRLRHSILGLAQKHPILLRPHPLLDLIIRHHHSLTLHGGSQLTLASLRNEFWIIRARTTVRSIIHRCVPCVRERALVPAERMGDLPRARITRSSRAFEHTGVDYAGPIIVKTAPGRGYKTQKAYIALFICLTVKAIHLELVSDYSTSAFIAAYHRFVSRRGTPASMYSDNGTTFQGSAKELRNAHAQAMRDSHFQGQVATAGVQWHFLPPAAPHFGGLWEAGVKSMKHHLKRCIGSQTLTFEEMTTFLSRVEACLNSRPLAPVSDQFDDCLALTPSHFLIGTSLLAPPEPSVLDIKENRLSRWQMIQRTTEHFWRAWSSDYLHTLQQRPKWRTAQRLAKVGRLVLLRHPNAPPSQWRLGRISKCHPGDDGLTRVVTVKTGQAEYVRPIVKLCFLPVDINDAEHPVPSTAGGDLTTSNSTT